ncbi:Fc receptor 5 [Labeo rohita]|uniref:Fc receptor 5 n=1 Tax=Labeo rohita TaxID=84645 RepID=A0A498L2A0_LABRO|nr:Fc receptor 5 [Labeo rohita]
MARAQVESPSDVSKMSVSGLFVPELPVPLSYDELVEAQGKDQGLEIFFALAATDPGGRSQSPSTVSQQQNNSQTSDQKHSEAGYNTLLSGTAHIYDSVDAAVKDISTDSVSESTEHIYAEIELKSTKKQKKKKENKENKTESPDCIYSNLMLQTDQGAGSSDVTYAQVN